MTIGKRKVREKEELRSKILRSARDLFMEKGFEQTSMRNIAERIEYSPTTIYLYFKDKDDVFYALHQEGFAVMNQYFKPLSLVSHPFERLKALSKAYIQFAIENGEYYDLMFIVRSPMNAIDKERGDWKEGHGAFTFLVNTIQECIDHGYFKSMDAELLAFSVWAWVHGIVSLEIRNRCSVVSEMNQPDLAEKANRLMIEILEKMHNKK